MPEQIDIESLLATIGPEAVMRGRPTLHKYQLEKAANLSKDIRRRLLRYMATDAFQPGADLAPFDYKDVLALVSQENPAAGRALFKAVPDRELATELGLEAERIRTWANGVIPRDAPAPGEETGEPDAHTMADFRRVWEVACDPMVVLRDLADGSLSDDQVQTLALLYPALYAEIRQAISDARATMKGRRGSWALSPIKAAQLGSLLQEPQFDPELAATVQQVYAQQPRQGQQAPAPARRRTNTPANPSSDLTPGQRAAGG